MTSASEFSDSPAITAKITNVVASVNLNHRLDLEMIAHLSNDVCESTTFHPKKSQLVMKILEPKTTAMIYASGKITLMGSKSGDDSFFAAQKITAIINRVGYAIQLQNYKITNLMASFNVGFKIRLETLALSLGPFSSYEPELFPGLIYRDRLRKVGIKVFTTGRVTMTGAKDRETIEEAFVELFDHLVVSELIRK